jgi:hypothetical protein
VAALALAHGALALATVRACPYCAEQIQDAAIVCRFCGREISKPRLPTQRYTIDERLKSATTRVDPKPRPSLWAKIGGAIEGLGTSERRPGRSGARESMFREYASVRKYQADVDRLIPVGWVIDQQVDRPEKIVVRWVREPR